MTMQNDEIGKYTETDAKTGQIITVIAPVEVWPGMGRGYAQYGNNMTYQQLCQCCGLAQSEKLDWNFAKIAKMARKHCHRQNHNLWAGKMKRFVRGELLRRGLLHIGEWPIGYDFIVD